MKVYDPIDFPKRVADGLWICDGAIVRLPYPIAGGISFPTRMTIVRLADSGLWIWSPIELSTALRERVDALGPVAHLVSPNKIHYAHVAAWKRAYPSAIAWASPGVRDRAKSQNVDVTFDRDLGDVPERAWSSELDQLIFRGSRLMDEIVFFHRATRTLIVADLIENFESAMLTTWERFQMRLGGVRDPDGKASRYFRRSFFGRHEEANKSLDRIRAWNPERIVIAHGRWYERNGGAELERAFRWV
jgi:hypothetical protein